MTSGEVWLMRALCLISVLPADDEWRGVVDERIMLNLCTASRWREERCG